MNAIILSIGDELVLGQTVDTNSAWISQQLAAVGCDVTAHATVADDQPAIEEAIRYFAARCGVLIVSGGLGPTEDDLTRQALANVMNAPLELNESWLAELRGFFEKRGRAMPEANRIQAMIPRGAQMLWNTNGTAAGIAAELNKQALGAAVPTAASASATSLASTGEVTDSDKGAAIVAPTPVAGSANAGSSSGGVPGVCKVFVLPGVPKEMKAMFHRDVLPAARLAGGGAAIVSRTLHTFGLGESAIAEKVGLLMRRDRNPSVGTTVSGGVVSLRLNSRFPSVQKATSEMERTEAECRAALGDLIYGHDGDTLPAVVARLLTDDPHIAQIGPCVATAESCTGGLLAKMLTDVPGSSRYFKQGYITYANTAKTALLNVPAKLIEEHGAVSEPVVIAMATGAREQARVAYALAISGVAGPDGGTPEKPVGTVCIALAHPTGTVVRTYNLPGDREMIRDRAAKMALTMLRYHLMKKTMPF
jgi:nicotinamide-nucleotide amidase